MNRLNALTLMSLELNAGVLEKVDALLRVHVLAQVELEVELPRTDTLDCK